jgi:hypothetical protein
VFGSFAFPCHGSSSCCRIARDTVSKFVGFGDLVGILVDDADRAGVVILLVNSFMRIINRIESNGIHVCRLPASLVVGANDISLLQ